MSSPIVRWLRRHDPEWYALHKAIKVSVVVTAGVAIGTLLGNPQLTLFASFGGVALLLFADFPGSRSARFGAYVGLAAVGAVLITVGTLVSLIGWLAVLGMAVVGFLVLFAGVLSAAAAAATRAALLTFILPATVPAAAADIPSRLGGWGIALALSIPAAILVWPPRDHDKLRARAAEACAALAAQLTGPAPATQPQASATTATATDWEARDAESRRAIVALRRQFRSTTYRPVGLTTGSRVLMQLLDRLEWLRAVANRVPAGPTDRWPPTTVDLVESCADVLRACAAVLATAAHRPTYDSRQRLATALRELDQHRARVSVLLDVIDLDRAGTPAGAPAQARQSEHDGQEPEILRPAVAHELAYTTRLTGHTVAVSATADARPIVDRLLGRQPPGSVEGSVAAARRIVTGHITRRSVWFQNSLRGALGLSIAVFLAELTQIAHGFWVVLGAMSVLRTTALTTGSTAWRALIGTVIGFLAGAAIMLAVGGTPWHLWLLLPFVIVVAAYLPEAVSFAAGQAAFTVMVVILFNIIQPTGWTVGLIRIEDIAMGCAAGVISGILLWPRGAAAQIRTALADTYRRSAVALQAAGGRLTGHPAVTGTLDEVMSDARAAGLRLDDAFREYLFERGTKAVPVAELTAVANGATRVRLAAEAIAGMSGPMASPPPPSLPPGDPAPRRAVRPLAAAGSDIWASASAAAEWYQRLAGVLDHSATGVPPIIPVQGEARVLGTFRREADILHDPAVAARARTLWSASLYIDDVTLLQQRLTGYVETLERPGTPGAPADDETMPGPAAAPTPAGTPTATPTP
ncbi:MAG TPA: FUSC family protein [Nakamurella sp.]